MAGNGGRRGAVRKGKKGPTTGSGGVRRRGLEGRGPTPKAEDRPAHKKHAAKAAAARGASLRGTAPRRGGRPEQRTGSDQVAGRNAVLEALREDVPATGLVLMHRLDTDDRVREILRLAATRSLPVREATRAELDRLRSEL